jgi:hypothetical protein
VISWLRRETVTRERPDFSRDSYGNTVADWSNPGLLPIAGCLFAPGAGQEVLTNRDGVQLAGTVYAPPAADVTASDAVTVRGVRYAVVGEPQQWAAGTVINLEKWVG